MAVRQSKRSPTPSLSIVLGTSGNAGGQNITNLGTVNGATISTDFEVKFIKVNITKEQLQILNATPVNVISHPGAGKFIRIMDAVFGLNQVGTPAPLDGILYLFDHYQLNIHNFINSASSILKNAWVDITDIDSSGGELIEDADIMLTSEIDFTGIDSDVDIYITYKVITK